MPRLSLVALLPLVGFSSVLAYTNIDADVFMYKPIDSLLAYVCPSNEIKFRCTDSCSRENTTRTCIPLQEAILSLPSLLPVPNCAKVALLYVSECFCPNRFADFNL